MDNRLKEIRTARKLTQEELAEKLNTTKVHISRIETGKTRLTSSWLTRLSAALDCSVADIVGELKDNNSLELGSDELSLIFAYRELPPDMQLAMRTIATNRAPGAAAAAAAAAPPASANFEFLLSALQEAMRKEGLPSLSTGTALRLMASIADEMGIQIDGLGQATVKAPDKSSRAA